VTISGPPRTLARLVESRSIRAHPLSIDSPYHASHLFGLQEVDEVLGYLRDDRLKDYRQQIPLVSVATSSIVTTDFQGLLRQAITETLCQQVRWDNVFAALRSGLSQYVPSSSCVVYPVASAAAALLSSALAQESNLKLSILDKFNTKVERIHTSAGRGVFQDSKIAVVGYSGRYPEAASNDEFWQLLVAARDCHRTIPEDRFDWEAHYDTGGKEKNRSRVKFGCFINDPGLFDTRFFNLSPREAENMDPAQRLALMSTYEAMEMAGLVPDRTPSTQRDPIGVFFGTTSDDWREVNSGQDIGTYFIPGGNRAFVSGRISYFFRFSGPSISVDTACSSSLAAISTACSSLWQGECDSAIAGGTNVLTNPDNFVGLDRGHFLSTTGNCNPFDDSASGYCRADAVGAVVLKRLEDAVADHDTVLGVIGGCSTNHNSHSVSITRPHEGDQLSLFRRVRRHSNTDPRHVSYIEMHGTGTQAGDAAEMRSVLGAFAPDHSRVQGQPLHLGAVKANVGHAGAASGVTALIKVLLMMQHSAIPPHRLDGPLNSSYPADLAQRNVHINCDTNTARKATPTPTPWRRSDFACGERVAFVNNFSAAGGNTAILLQDAPLPATADIDSHSALDLDSDPHEVLPVAVTAKTSQSLLDNIRALIDHLESTPDTILPALSYTTTSRRAHYKFRVLVAGSNIVAIKAALQLRLHDTFQSIKTVPPPVAHVFTGQGTLYAAMARPLFDNVAIFRSHLVSFDRIAQRHGFPSFLPLISGEVDFEDAQTLDPVMAHLYMTCVQMALARL
jgi:naphtho-gamma-pyrone polyketide synthase